MPEEPAFYGELKVTKLPLRNFLKNHIVLLFYKTRDFFFEARAVEESRVVSSAGGEEFSRLIDERFNIMDI